MTKAQREQILGTIEQVDIDLKFIMAERRKAQDAIDAINDKARAAMTRLQMLEATMEKAK